MLIANFFGQRNQMAPFGILQVRIPIRKADGFTTNMKLHIWFKKRKCCICIISSQLCQNGEKFSEYFFLSASVFFRFCYLPTIFRLRTRIQLCSNYDMETCSYVLFPQLWGEGLSEGPIRVHCCVFLMHVKY